MSELLSEKLRRWHNLYDSGLFTKNLHQLCYEARDYLHMASLEAEKLEAQLPTILRRLIDVTHEIAAEDHPWVTADQTQSVIAALRDGYFKGVNHALSVMQGSICGILHAWETQGTSEAQPPDGAAPCHRYVAGAWQVYLAPYDDKFSISHFACLYGFCPQCGEQLTEGGPGSDAGPEEDGNE